MPNFSLSGRVVRATDLAPLPDIAVRLVGSASALADLSGAQPQAQGWQICWTRRLVSFAGTRWDCWTTYVQNHVRGMAWEQFRDGVLTHNPTLANDRLFKADQDYLLPEDVAVAPYTWTRQLTGFGGSRWDCWAKQVQGSVPGLTWEQFRDGVLAYNPQLNADGRLFQPFKSYLLPEPNAAPRAYLETTTDAQGVYRLDLGAQSAVYELQVEVDGFARFVLPLVVNSVITQPITLTPQPANTTRSGNMRSARTDYPTLPEPARRVIDQALRMLGDDAPVFDALPSELQPMCYGARFLGDPHHANYKDFACADLVSIAFRAAGLDMFWRSAANPHMADYFHPDRGNAKLIEISAPNDWLPGDVLVYGNGALNSRAGHVNLYVGPFSGTDRSGKTYNLSDGQDVVEASLEFRSNGHTFGTGIIGANLQRCLQSKRGVYSWVRHVRLRELVVAFGRG